MRASIRESMELVDGIVAVAIRLNTALADDGKVSTFEGLGLLQDFKAVKTALVGITEVPKELLAADEESHAVLRGKIVQGLDAVGITHRVQDITDRILRWITDTVEMVLFIRNAPPSAEAVD